MTKALVLFVIGLICLIYGGDFFVDGSTGIAHKFHLPEILIGATIVSIGTTLPEVMVSATSALKGIGDIAYGNAIGSVICNTALISAITIAFRPGQIDSKSLRIPVLFFFAAASIYCLVAYTIGYFYRIVGFIMIALFVVYMITTVKQMYQNPSDSEQHEEAEENPIGKCVFLLVFGAVLITVGANLLVDNGTIIARGLGVPESVIALTFVALGTSLPELITAITSLMKGHSSLSLGNVIGANLFNLVLVCGVSVSLAPFSVPNSAMIFGMNSSLVLEIPVMLAVMLLLTVPTLLKGKLYRIQGLVLLLIYAAFIVIQFSL